MRPARKIATNLSIRADIVTEAKAQGLNLSEVFETALEDAVRRKRQEAWLAENAQAIYSRIEAKLERGAKNIGRVMVKTTMSEPVKVQVTKG